ncbi:putative phosphatidylinositol 3-kinase regulatory subunit gamma [Triplophysa rosa]|uniref:Phosphatidylinositol 3-kinase regulatory subunit gamma n=1 Tax=Triplophysa rosa TaxID=992332 RepID=A0A9W7WT26_TRIRA|nr:putative phosphatidylinositol 3-kinase regulatory subunit gamma [Triplophysa rosa]
MPMRFAVNVCNPKPPRSLCHLHQSLRAVVLRLTEALERQGWESEPLYRTALTSTGPPELFQALETDPAAVDFEQYELSVLADTLRGYLQDLPCTIIPAVVYSELVYTAQEIQSMEECGQQLKRILDSPSIPQANHQLLVHLTRHLSKVTQSEGAAQATPRLLAMAYSEAIFKHNHFSADVNPEHHVKILEALIMVGGLVEIQAAPDERKSHMFKITAGRITTSISERMLLSAKPGEWAYQQLQ